MSISDFIKRYPVLTYYILTFAISWGGFSLVIAPYGFLGTEENLDTMFPLAVMVMLTGPCIAGILLTVLLSGKTGLRELFSQFLKWRINVRWYVIALLPAPLLMVAILFAFSLTSPIFTEDYRIVLLLGIMVGFTTVLEEVGWTGFAVPKFRLRYGIFTTGVIMGILWGAWHFLQVLWMSNIYAGTVPLGIFLLLYILFSITHLTAYRVLLVWIYDRTESLLVTTLMHASLAASTVVIFRPLETGVPFLIYAWVLAAALWILVAVVIVANGGHLTRQPRRNLDG
ncbi:MAG: CPBP family intramembrane metalloprotease [Promethearchaeota archaeon]|nr:MAG: CPBP family intramembrane metalloprotease [Candidatus Lokiarchaeota archaeon]